MNAKEIGKKIKIRRTEIGLTQSQLACSAKLSVGTVIAAETGKSNVRIDSIMRLVGAVGLSPSTLGDDANAVNIEKEVRILLDKLNAVSEVMEVTIKVRKSSDGVDQDSAYGFKKA